MRKLVESTYVSLGGVISDPSVWQVPYEDDEHAEYARRLLFAADALLLGRRTYERFAATYPRMTGEFADRMNRLPKYVASTTLRETTWNATLISGDVAHFVAELKRRPGQNILKYGTGPLDRVLIEHDLIDEFHLWLVPVAIASGQRLFEDVRRTTHLKLVDTTTFGNGVVVHTYSHRSRHGA